MILGQPFSPFRIFTGVFIPDALLSYKGINAGEKICLARLYRYCGKSDTCWPSQDELSSELGTDIRSIQRHINSLSTQGFIRIEQRGLGQTNQYVMLAHPVFFGEGSVSGLDTTKVSGQEATDIAGPDATKVSGPLHLSCEESQVKRVNSISDELTPRMKWSIFQTRIKKAGVEFNFRYSEKKQAQDWLAVCEEPFDDILAALQVFADDAFWTSQGHPWNAWPKQFDQFLETARAMAQRDDQSDDDSADHGNQPEPVVDAPQRAVAPKRDFLTEWNMAVPDAFTEREPRRKVNIEPEFIAAFDKICEVARGIRRNKPDSTWLTFYYLFAVKDGHTRENWKRLITDMRGMAAPAYPESGQNAQSDDEGYERWKQGGVNAPTKAHLQRWVLRQSAEMMAEGAEEEARAV